LETLAGNAISLVAPYLVKGAEEFAKCVGKAAFDQCSALVERLRRWWSGNPVAAAAADNLAKDPANYSTILGQLLNADLQKDPALAAEIRECVENAGPSIYVIQKIEIANGVTGADIGEIVSGSIKVVHYMNKATNVTAVRASKVGG